MNKNIINAVGWNISAKLMTTGIYFFSIPMFAHLLSTNEYGIYALYMSWLGVLIPLVSCGLHLSVARAKIEFEDHYSKYVSGVTFLVVLLFLSGLIMSYFYIEDLSSLLGLTEKMVLILIVHSFFNVVSLIGVEYLRYQGKYIKTAILDVLQPFLIMSCGMLFIKYGVGDAAVMGRVLGAFIPVSVIGFVLVANVFSKGRTFYNYSYWKYGLGFSFPLVFGALALILNAQVDKLLITKYFGASQTGVYSFSYTIGMLVMLVGSAIKQAINPWIFEYLKNKKTAESLAVNLNFAKVITLASIILVFISPELVELMSPAEYHYGTKFIAWIIIGAFFQQLMAIEITSVMFLKKSKLYSIISISGVIVNIVMNIFLIPEYGLFGAAVTTTLTYCFMFVLMVTTNRYALNFSIFKIDWYLKLCCVMLLSLLIFYSIRDDVVMRMGGVTIVCFAFLYYHIKEIKHILSNVRLTE